MNHWCVTLLVALTAAFWTARQEPQGIDSSDLEKVQGQWVPTMLYMGNRLLDEKALPTLLVTFEGDTFKLEQKGRKVTDAIKLRFDASKKPKTLDLTVPRGERKGEVELAIYDLKGDKLKICVGGVDEGRPKDFRLPLTDNDRVVMVLRRAPQKDQAAAKDAEANDAKAIPGVPRDADNSGAPRTQAPASTKLGDLKELQGKWPVVTKLYMGGEDLSNEPDFLKSLSVAIKGNTLCLNLASGGISGSLMAIEGASYSGAKLKTLDYTLLKPDGGWTTSKGILDFDGTTLRVCIGTDAKNAPKNFDAPTKDDGRVIFFASKAKTK